MLASGTITWKLKKQTSIALVTTEAEYYMLGIACQEAIWVKKLCQELLMSFSEPINIYMDNTGVVALSDNPIFHNRKHIDIRWHLICDLICSKLLCSSHIPRTHNRADFLTKAPQSFRAQAMHLSVGYGIDI